MSRPYNFVYVLRPAGTLNVMEPDAAQSIILREHFAYLQGLLQNGTLLLAGPATDGAFGLVIFHAPDEASAREIMLNDPAVQGALMDASLHPYRVSLLAGQG